MINKPADDKEAIKRAFAAWLYRVQDRNAEKRGTPKQVLANQLIELQKTLENQASVVQINQYNTEEYHTQKSALFLGYLSAQRLGMSVCKNSTERAQQKAIANLSNHSNILLQKRISEALAANLAKISQLKDVIAQQEHTNDDLSQQNDSYRNGAFNAV